MLSRAHDSSCTWCLLLACRHLPSDCDLQQHMRSKLHTIMQGCEYCKCPVLNRVQACEESAVSHVCTPSTLSGDITETNRSTVLTTKLGCEPPPFLIQSPPFWMICAQCVAGSCSRVLGAGTWKTVSHRLSESKVHSRSADSSHGCSSTAA